eukprot:scaffold2012_cov193-Cylindrotheca_fusiformis.AAC.10
MKLVIAAAVLANALPAMPSGDSDVSVAVDLHDSLRMKPRKLLVQQKFGEIFAKIQRRRKSRILRNLSRDAAQCDPTLVGADVGILSCGSGQYCMESTDYDFGGVCVGESIPVIPDRRLYEDGYYVNAAAYYCSSSGDRTEHLTCDCSRFENNSKTGSVKCALVDSYCLEDASCETCVNLTAEFKIDSANGYSIDWCYDFVSPIEQSICVEYAHGPSESTDCIIEFNTVQCNSCSVIPYHYIDAETKSAQNGTCAAFDCANTEGKHVGSLCDGLDNLATILNQTCTEEADREIAGTSDASRVAWISMGVSLMALLSLAV